MKNFFKKIAFVLALAMVLTNIGPMVAASAAEVPSLRYSSRVLYVGGDATGKYANDCWTPSQNTKGYTVSYKVTEGTNLIDVASNGKITATGNGVGKAVVTVTYKKAGEKDITAKFTLKIRRNATDVRLTNASQTAIETALKIGDELELKAAKSFVGKSYKTGNFGVGNYIKLVTDQLELVSSNPEVVKVDGFKITAVADGTATITVRARQYLTGELTKVESPAYPVVVLGGLQEAKQITSTTIKATFGQELPSGTSTDNFLITNTKTMADYGISKLDVSSDRMSVTIETFSGMTDGAVYELTYNKGKEDEASATFTATDGVVTKLAVNKTEIPYNYETLITVDLYDAEGVKIASVKESESANYNLDWTWKSIAGSLAEDKLILYSKGDKATLEVIYRVYDDNGKEINTINETFNITAINVAIDADLYFVINSDDDKPCRYDWLAAATNADKRTYIYADKDPVVTDKVVDYVHLYITNSSGDEISQTLFQDYGYYLESSNESILQVEPYEIHDHTQWTKGHFADDQGIYAAVYGLKSGTANVLIKNANGEIVKVVPVTVRAKSAFKNFDLSTTTLNYLSNTTLLNDEGKVEITVVDQFGTAESGDYSNYIDVELQSGPSNSKHPYTNIGRTDSWVGPHNRLNFNGNDCDPGTYRYKITMSKGGTTVTKYVSVVVRKPDGTDSYKLVIDGDSDAVYVNSWESGTRSTNIKVAQYKGGVIYQYLPFAASGANTVKEVKITNNSLSGVGLKVTTVNDSGIVDDNGVVKATAVETDGTGTPDTTVKYYVSDASIVSGSSVGVIQKVNKGLRSVSVVIIDNNNKEKTLSSSFNVTDTQTPVTATVSKTGVSVSNSSITDIESVIKEVLDFKVNGRTINDGAETNCITVKEITMSGASVVSGTAVSKGATRSGNTLVASGDKISVGTVTIEYIPQGLTHYVTYTITVNRIFQVNR